MLPSAFAGWAQSIGFAAGYTPVIRGIHVGDDDFSLLTEPSQKFFGEATVSITGRGVAHVFTNANQKNRILAM
jgi:hypothetical protein